MKKDAPILDEHIRLEAFLLSERAGHPTGMDEFFWTQAEAIIHGRTAVVVGPGKPLKTKAKMAEDIKKPAAQNQLSAKAEPSTKSKKTPASKRKK